MCTKVFYFNVETPPIDTNLTIRGHMKASLALFESEPAVIQITHIPPFAHEITYDCFGATSKSLRILHQETVCNKTNTFFLFLFVCLLCAAWLINVGFPLKKKSMHEFVSFFLGFRKGRMSYPYKV